VAADPYVEEKRNAEYFGTDLLSEGILPVHLVIRNNSGSTYLFDPRDVSCSFAIGNPEATESTAAQGRVLQDKKAAAHEAAGEAAETVAEGMVVAGGHVSAHALDQAHSFTAPGLAAGLGIGVGGALLAWAMDYEVQQNEVRHKSLARKQIFEKTFFTGETLSGFVYFKHQDPSRLADINNVVIRMVEKKTSRAITIAVPMRQGLSPSNGEAR
jgi:hypothetical protein